MELLEHFPSHLRYEFYSKTHQRGDLHRGSEFYTKNFNTGVPLLRRSRIETYVYYVEERSFPFCLVFTTNSAKR